MADANFQLLKNVEFLGGLTDDQLRQLAAEVTPVEAEPGAVICKQGDTDGTFYIIKTGFVDVVAKNPKGEVVLQTRLKPGEFFGEFALMTGEARTATCTAATAAELLSIGKPEMKQILAANRAFSDYISGVLAWRQYRLEARMGVTKFVKAQEAREVAASKSAAPSAAPAGKAGAKPGEKAAPAAKADAKSGETAAPAKAADKAADKQDEKKVAEIKNDLKKRISDYFSR